MKGLGRGLASLIGEDDTVKTVNRDNIAVMMSVDYIKPNKSQPRKEFEHESLSELSESIKKDGILSPILVNKLENGGYSIIAGERRWRAAKIAGLQQVPVIIKNLEDKDQMRLALIENIQRKDLTPLEEASAYENLINSHNLTQSELADLVGKSRPYITNILRLLTLPEKVREQINEGKISAGHAKILVKMENPEELAKAIVLGGLTVRNLEKLSRDRKSPKSKPAIYNNSDKDKELIAIEQNLTNGLGIKVELDLQRDEEHGKLSLYFNNLRELDRILTMIHAEIHKKT